MLVDVFITTKGRPDLFERSLRSFFDCTSSHQYRLTIVDDSGDGSSFSETNTQRSIDAALYRQDHPHVDFYLKSRENQGLGPSINQALAHIETVNRWYSDSRAGDPSRVSDFVCYCQDDLLYTPGWLQRLTKMFLLLEDVEKLGFATGLECVEHPAKKDLGGGMVLKDWIRAAQMFGRRSYWASMWPIPRFDPETGRVRAKPNDGWGSGVDWWFVRNAENSVCRTGRSCLVVPGLVQHLGYDQSTWLARELPESDADKAAIKGSR